MVFSGRLRLLGIDTKANLDLYNRMNEESRLESYRKIEAADTKIDVSLFIPQNFSRGGSLF